MEANSLPFYFPNSYSMSRLRKNLKPISLLLAIVVLLQGCTIYKQQNITLESAAIQGAKVKVVTKDNKTQKYLYITSINDEYYGVIKGKDGLLKIPLQQENIKNINIKNKAASLAVNILASFGILSAVTILVVAIIILV